MSMASEVMKLLLFAVLDVSSNSGHYTVIIKRLLSYIDMSRRSQIVCYNVFQVTTRENNRQCLIVFAYI